MNDTDPKTEAIYREMLLAKTPEERFLMGIRMCQMARTTVLASLPKNLSPIDRKVAILRRYYESDLSDTDLARVEQALRTAAETKPLV
ncbi:MAG TPA: hypothetical protein VGM54_17040 [Chthoniobacter sp.]|jgi:hypothetical protein